MADHDRDELLKILESHGQQFLSSFEVSSPEGKKRKSKGSDDRQVKRQKSDQDEEEFEDWNGFTADAASELPSNESGSLFHRFELKFLKLEPRR